jgi:hypothetical protein
MSVLLITTKTIGFILVVSPSTRLRHSPGLFRYPNLLQSLSQLLVISGMMVSHTVIGSPRILLADIDFCISPMRLSTGFIVVQIHISNLLFASNSEEFSQS